MATPSSSSLSHALHPPQRLQSDQQLPRLQLAPPEHQKHLQSQALARQQQESSQQHAHQMQSSTLNPSAHREHEREQGTPIFSSREASPAIGLDESTSAGEKRKSNASNNIGSKKRRTEQQEERHNSPPLAYGLGTHYPYAFYGQGTPGLTPVSATQPDNGFNEFQWRILNLCGEFYEAATELIRSTPHLVLSQAFQLLGRGIGIDPISVLNDARRTCDALLANPHALATPPPMPAVMPLPVLNSLAQLNARVTAAAPGSVAAPYYTPPAPPAPPVTLTLEKPSKGKEKERFASNVQGAWKDHEVEKLKALAEKYRIRDRSMREEEEEEEEEEEADDGETVPDNGLYDGQNPNADIDVSTDRNANAKPKKKARDLGEIDWDKVVAEFGDERSRHQVLIKATALNLKASSSIPSNKPKKKKPAPAAIEPPPPTFSSSSVKNIPVNYAALSLPTTPATSSFKIGTTSSSTLLPKPAVAPVLPGMPGMPYPQPGWYGHSPPQGPYYPYAQPLYYPQSYSGQNYGILGGPQPGYYSPYVPPLEAPEKGPSKGRVRKSNGTTPASNITNTSTSSSAPVPPPTLPPKIPGRAPEPTSTPSGDAVSKRGVMSAASSSEGNNASATSSPVVPPQAPGGGGGIPGNPASSSASLPRRLPAGSTTLFTYAPLPHGSTTVSAEPGK